MNNINDDNIENLDTWRNGNYVVQILDGYFNYEQVKKYILDKEVVRINKEIEGHALALEKIVFRLKHGQDITKVIKEDVKEKDLKKDVKILHDKLADFAEVIDKNTRKLNERLNQIEEVIEDKFNYTFPTLTEE